MSSYVMIRSYYSVNFLAVPSIETVFTEISRKLKRSNDHEYIVFWRFDAVCWLCLSAICAMITLQIKIFHAKNPVAWNSYVKKSVMWAHIFLWK